MKERHKFLVWMVVGLVISVVLVGCCATSRIEFCATESKQKQPELAEDEISMTKESLEEMKQEAVQSGANMVVNSIIQQVEQSGEVVIRRGNMQIILVPKVPVDPNSN